MSIRILIGPAVYLSLSPILKSITRRLNLDLPVGASSLVDETDYRPCWAHCSLLMWHPAVHQGFGLVSIHLTLLKTAIGHRGLPLDKSHWPYPEHLH